MDDRARLGFGAANLGNLYREVDDDRAWAILDAAWASGIRYFDTAPHYGLGLSERRLGAFLATKPRDEFIVSTKVGRRLRSVPNPHSALDLDNDFAVPADNERYWDFTRHGIRRSLDESLERLGLDRVDILFLHDPEMHDLTHAREHAYPALTSLRDEGLVSSVGIGSMSVEALQQAAETEGLDLLMVAGRLTLAEQPALESVVPTALANDIEIVAAGVFNSGVLATNEPGEGSRYEYGSVPHDLLRRVQTIAAVCHEFAVDLPTAALQYPLRVHPVRSVIIAGSHAHHITDNAARLKTPIPEELWAELTQRGLVP